MFHIDVILNDIILITLGCVVYVIKGRIDMKKKHQDILETTLDKYFSQCFDNQTKTDGKIDKIIEMVEGHEKRITKLEDKVFKGRK